MNVIDTHGNGLIRLIESELSDNSKVYDIWIDDNVVVCDSKEDAESLFETLTRYTIIGAHHEYISGKISNKRR